MCLWPGATNILIANMNFGKLRICGEIIRIHMKGFERKIDSRIPPGEGSTTWPAVHTDEGRVGRSARRNHTVE
jgi:hypothetical protein